MKSMDSFFLVKSHALYKIAPVMEYPKYEQIKYFDWKASLLSIGFFLVIETISYFWVMLFLSMGDTSFVLGVAEGIVLGLVGIGALRGVGYDYKNGALIDD